MRGAARNQECDQCLSTVLLSFSILQYSMKWIVYPSFVTCVFTINKALLMAWWRTGATDWLYSASQCGRGGIPPCCILLCVLDRPARLAELGHLIRATEVEGPFWFHSEDRAPLAEARPCQRRRSAGIDGASEQEGESIGRRRRLKREDSLESALLAEYSQTVAQPALPPVRLR